MPRRLLLLLVACLFGVLALLLGNGAGAPSFAAPKPRPPAQSVVVRVLPQIASPGLTPEPASAALTTMTAAFSPVVPGRQAYVEVMDGKKWVALATSGQQDAAGRVLLTVPYAWRGLPATYRVVGRSSVDLPAVTSAQVRTSSWGTPILSDEFSGTALAAPWDHRYQGYDVPNRKCSRTDASATAVGDGVLSLSVIKDASREDLCTWTNAKGEQESTFYRLNGHVGTQGRFAYKYGVAAARVKFQEARGQHGAFWMQPAGTGYGVEIDVIEWLGTGSLGLVNGVFDSSSGTQKRVAGGVLPDQSSYGSDWAGTYHVFSVEWTPTEYVFRIDGKEALRTTAGVAQTEEYLILSLLVSQFEANKLPSPESLPQTMSVDWVRVWQQ